MLFTAVLLVVEGSGGNWVTIAGRGEVEWWVHIMELSVVRSNRLDKSNMNGF